MVHSRMNHLRVNVQGAFPGPVVEAGSGSLASLGSALSLPREVWRTPLLGVLGEAEDAPVLPITIHPSLTWESSGAWFLEGPVPDC